jgi:hypothetical protein
MSKELAFSGDQHCSIPQLGRNVTTVPKYLPLKTCQLIDVLRSYLDTSHVGKPEYIGMIFAGFKKYIYQQAAVA